MCFRIVFEVDVKVLVVLVRGWDDVTRRDDDELEALAAFIELHLAPLPDVRRLDKRGWRGKLRPPLDHHDH